MLAAYGGGICAAFGIEMGYEQWVWLWLNLDRVQRRKAIPVAEGTAAAGTTADLDWTWADAMASLPESAEDLHFRINAERQTIRAKIRRGFPIG